MGRSRSPVQRLRHGLKLTLVGVVIGLATAFGATRFIASLLFVSPTDGLTFTAISALLAVSPWSPAFCRRAAPRGLTRWWRFVACAEASPLRKLFVLPPKVCASA